MTAATAAVRRVAAVPPPRDTPGRWQPRSPAATTISTHLLLRRAPTTQELATQLGVSRDQGVEAGRCAHAYRPWSLEQPMAGTEDLRLIDLLSSADLGLDAVDRRESLRRALARLPARERRVIVLRFVDEMTQTQIAERIGVSQMQVSRLLTRSLARLRDTMQAGTATAVHGAGRTGLARQVVGASSSGGH